MSRLVFSAVYLADTFINEGFVMVGTLVQDENCSDAELVVQSRRGSREAFGRIVRRYQGMIAGAAYSVCGDLHVSEDVAQETFLAAWKSLSGLKEPEKISPWLCQIARRKALDYQRSKTLGKSRLALWFQMSKSQGTTSPAEEALSEEERTTLWRFLSELPHPYRETMVLYYRQGQSSVAVALAMETTQETVRQRLTRGRAMLREQVAVTLERDLVRSAPATAFAVAVLAALPALTAPTAKAATLGAAAKGSTMLGGGGAMVWASTVFGGLAGVWSGVFALRNALRASQSGRERRFVYIFAGLGILCAATWVTASVVAERMFSGHDFHGLGTTSLLIGVMIATLIMIRVGRRHMNEIRLSEPSDGTAPSSPFAGRHRKLPLGLIAAIVLSGVGPWIIFAWRARDFASIGVLLVLGIGLTIVGGYCWGGGSVVRTRWFSILYVPIIAIITLCVMKWRLNEWLAVIYHWKHYHPMPWRGLLLLATVFACGEVVVLELVGFWRRNPFKRGSDGSVGPVRRLDMIGFNFLYADKQVTLKTISQIAGEEVPKLFAAMKAANIQARGPVVFIYPTMTGDPGAVLDVKMGIAVEKTHAAPEGYQVEEIPPANCQTVLYSGPMTTIREAFHVLIPALYGGAAAPTGEIRVYHLNFEGTNSPNNVMRIAGVVKLPA